MATAPQEFEVPRIPQQSEQIVSAEPMNLLAIALRNNAAIDVIERLAALQRDHRDYLARVAFDEALNRCQKQLTRISADATNPETRSRWATYAKLDKVVRPIYTAEGFSLSFAERDCPTPGKTRFVAFLCRAGVMREFPKDVSPSTKGPKGNDVMTPIHADGAADSYAKRYLLKDIFNIAIGEDDTDGNAVNPDSIQQDRVGQLCAQLSNAKDESTLRTLFRAAYQEASAAKDKRAQQAYIAAKDARLRGLR